MMFNDVLLQIAKQILTYYPIILCKILNKFQINSSSSNFNQVFFIMLIIFKQIQQIEMSTHINLFFLFLFCSLYGTNQSLQQNFSVQSEALQATYPLSLLFFEYDVYGNYVASATGADIKLVEDPEGTPKQTIISYENQESQPSRFHRASIQKNSRFIILTYTDSANSKIDFYIAQRESVDEQFSPFTLFHSQSITYNTITFILQISPDGKYVCFSMLAKASRFTLTVLTLDYTSGINVVNKQILDQNSLNIQVVQFTQDSKVLAFIRTEQDQSLTIKTVQLQTFTQTVVSVITSFFFILRGTISKYQIALVDQVVSNKVSISIYDSQNGKIVDKHVTNIVTTRIHGIYQFTSDFRFIVFCQAKCYIGQVNGDQLVFSAGVQRFKVNQRLIKYMFNDGEQDRILIPETQFQDPVFPFDSSDSDGDGDSSGDTSSEPVDCSLDKASTGVALTQFECQCYLHYIWDNSTRKCSANCNQGFALQPISGNPLKCKCKEGGIWDTKTKQCLINCRKIKHSTGQWVSTNVCECSQFTKWNALNLTCQPKCTGDFIDQKCICEEGHVWVDEKGACEKDCSLIDNTKYTRPIGSGSCQCSIGVWQGNSCGALDCSQISYIDPASSHNQQDDGICDCQVGFVWNSDEVKCKLDCSIKADSLTRSTNSGDTQCQCQPGAFWNDLAIRCFIDCSADPNAIDENINYQECVCEDRFRWSSSDLVCVSTCGERVGQENSFNDTENRCNCLDGFQYYQNSPEGGACYRSCSSIDHTDNHFGSKPNSCICQQGFKWDESNIACELSCDGLYDSGVNSDDSSICDCINSNTLFVEAIGKCMPICVNDALSTGSFNQDTFGCYCKKNAKWIISTASCTCDASYSQVNGECVSSDSSVVIIPVAIGGAVCSAGAVLAGMLIRQKRREAQEVGRQQNMQEDEEK